MSSSSSPPILHYYRRTTPPHSLLPTLLSTIPQLNGILTSISTENCFNVATSHPLSPDELSRLEWLLAETFAPSDLRPSQPFLLLSSTEEKDDDKSTILFEFGPRMTFTSAFSSNAVSICQSCRLSSITRLEKSRRYLLTLTTDQLSESIKEQIREALHDRMTEEEYLEPLLSFESGAVTKEVTVVPIMEEGRAALEKINESMGLGFDEFDLDYYTDIFKNKLGRNPTDVECFDMGQSNSEHSRHWFFSGNMIHDGQPRPQTLFQLVKDTLTVPNNSIIAFHDNSSSIRGYEDDVLHPLDPTRACEMGKERRVYHPILTAETHNFPSGVAPFPGAETGTGGRLRDVMATGRGAHPTAGISSYCVGNLHIPTHPLPWEDSTQTYPSNLAAPLTILISASDGASDYGNKYGEPVIHGFTRSFGQRLANGERVEWLKPIMFSAGVGYLDGRHNVKGEPGVGMLVVKVGGPAYRIGMGGGSASSRVQEGKNADLDFNAVQRGDAEMENRLNRLLRSCIDLGSQNPIISIHDQGAGGNGNVLKEIVEPMGADYDIRKVFIGDDTLSVLEIWGAEYQENNALLIKPESGALFSALAERERCPFRTLGIVTDTGRVIVRDSAAPPSSPTPVDLPLSLILGKMPKKTFRDTTLPPPLSPYPFSSIAIPTALNRILNLVSVGSKRFLVHKVDRSVTGLIAQQQCVGPLQLPLADVGVTASSHFSTRGTAVACGEQPLKGLLNPAAMARLCVAEMLQNMVWASWSSVRDIKLSGNWMYAAKLPGEGSKMYQAAEALKESLLAIGGIGIDGGKDSLSMAARAPDGEVVKSPGMLTLTGYVTCPDVRKTVTPDVEGDGRLLMVDLGLGYGRLGGSALGQVYGTLGEDVPDVTDWELFRSALNVTQELIAKGNIIRAGHDRSDGGVVVTILEMAFAGNCGVDVTIPPCTKGETHGGIVSALFNEEAGWVIEVANDEDVTMVIEAYKAANVPCIPIGRTLSPGEDSITIRVGDANADVVISEKMTVLRDTWEQTSFALEMKQRNPSCVTQEQTNLKHRTAPQWTLTYTPTMTIPPSVSETKHHVAILRQEGSNGDREMQAAFLTAGLTPWDVTVGDLLSGSITLDRFRGIVFVGGFSYADVLDSGKGWAGVIKFNSVKEQFEKFKARKDTFSLGVCNGCQLMALLGWIPLVEGVKEVDQPRLLENESGKFESRFSSVKILDSPAVLFKGMANSSLGIWVAHGEGRFHFPNPLIHQKVLSQNLAPLRYVNDTNTITNEYPFNPNGSPDGIAALCSEDGRHLAMMPHPERVFLKWQWPWMPKEWRGDDGEAGAWLKMFQNAKVFCDEVEG